jgi:hypothetical protein
LGADLQTRREFSLCAAKPSNHEPKESHACQIILAGGVGPNQPAKSFIVSLLLGDGLDKQIFAPFGFCPFVCNTLSENIAEV